MPRPMLFDHALAAALSKAGIWVTPGSEQALHENVLIEPPAGLNSIDFQGQPARVGAFTYFGFVGRLANAEIGRYCSVADGLQVGAGQHPTDFLTTTPIPYYDVQHFQAHFEARKPGWKRALPERFEWDLRPRTRIGNDVWIGAGVYIKDGVTIGDGAILGAHAVVTHDVPEYAVVAGVPAKVLRYRFPEVTIERLKAVAWWQYNIYDMAVDVRDVAAALSWIEDAVANGALLPYEDTFLNLLDECERLHQPGTSAQF